MECLKKINFKLIGSMILPLAGSLLIGLNPGCTNGSGLVVCSRMDVSLSKHGSRQLSRLQSWRRETEWTRRDSTRHLHCTIAHQLVMVSNILRIQANCSRKSIYILKNTLNAFETVNKLF
ncbi:Translocator protein [Caligus rogercresseyi]|uniref:Translocator protein n=1 Tax=Caligus rogercresseyi TaxID=217165 RepID=A0A7T8GYK2_CALRO|nr:Translocator protein [Caligus rogercresseyi]